MPSVVTAPFEARINRIKRLMDANRDSVRHETLAQFERGLRYMLAERDFDSVKADQEALDAEQNAAQRELAKRPDEHNPPKAGNTDPSEYASFKAYLAALGFAADGNTQRCDLQKCAEHYIVDLGMGEFDPETGDFLTYVDPKDNKTKYKLEPLILVMPTYRLRALVNVITTKEDALIILAEAAKPRNKMQFYEWLATYTDQKVKDLVPRGEGYTPPAPLIDYSDTFEAYEAVYALAEFLERIELPKNLEPNKHYRFRYVVEEVPIPVTRPRKSKASQQAAS